MTGRVALVTGANRGIGLEIVRQLARIGVRPVLAARDISKGRSAATALAAQGLHVETAALDVTSEDSVAAAVAEIEAAVGPIDILVNNAAILIDEPGGFSASAFDLDQAILRRTMETNVEGPLRLMKRIVPGMQARGFGRVVNVSSLAGQLAGMGAGFPAYRLSKVALTALTRIFADEVKQPNVKVNVMSPGWVRTDMGGPEAPRTVEQGADTAIWLATLPADGPTGGFFEDRTQMAW